MASRRHGSKRPATSSGNDPAVKSSHAPARSTMTRSLPDNDERSSNNSRRSYRNSRHKPAVQPQLPYSMLSFNPATDISDVGAQRTRLRIQLIIMRIVTLKLAQTSRNSAQQVAGWPYPQAEDALAAARAYNAKLARSGQPVLGEAIDPFSAAQGGSRAKGEDSAASKDKEYQSLLDSGDEVMGTIKIPKISVNLPIYHGTSQTALASGAGHLYGSSLPVGGDGTHSVITGHRGLVNAMMFTRLDEMKTGDFFYIEVMGETLGYEVDRITVINPDDTSQLKIVPGEDRVTLMTCTPYGVNTQRLLIFGHREPIPMPAPDPSDLHDTRTIVTMVVVCGLLGGWLLLGVIGRIRRLPFKPMRHASSWPRRMRG